MGTTDLKYHGAANTFLVNVFIEKQMVEKVTVTRKLKGNRKKAFSDTGTVKTGIVRNMKYYKERRSTVFNPC